MVVDDLDIVRVALRPAKADAPLIVDPDAVLPRTVATQLLEPVTGRNPEIVEPAGRVELNQFAQHDPSQIGRVVPDRLALPEARGVTISKAADHLL